jgi:hypothetical protein
MPTLGSPNIDILSKYTVFLVIFDAFLAGSGSESGFPDISKP